MIIPHRYKYTRGHDPDRTTLLTTAPIHVERIDNALRPPTSGLGDEGYGPRPPRTGEALESMCWCGRARVVVTTADVLNGRTGACRRAGCRR